MVKRGPADDFLDILKIVIIGVMGFLVIRALLQAF